MSLVPGTLGIGYPGTPGTRVPRVPGTRGHCFDWMRARPDDDARTHALTRSVPAHSSDGTNLRLLNLGLGQTAQTRSLRPADSDPAHRDGARPAAA
eukprot:857225-Rhodomonas_salina.1